MNAVLTVRDYSLIRFLYEEGVATGEQLASKFFPSFDAFHQRILKLKNIGLIRSRPVGKMKDIAQVIRDSTFQDRIYSDSSARNVHVYMLSDRLQVDDSRLSALSHPEMWRHQISLNKVREVFEPIFPGATILVEPEIEMLMRRSSNSLVDVALPDFVIEAQKNRIAFEMERTLKRSDARYLKKWLSYERQTYSHVVYVCASDRMLEYLSKLAKSFHKIGFCILTDPKKIYSSSLGFLSFEEFVSAAR